MKKKLIFVSSILFTLFIFFSLYIGLEKENTYKPKNIINSQIINFKGIDLFSDKTIELDNISKDKKFILINIWASWCSPCRLEHKYFLQLKKNEEIAMIGLNYKDKIENAKKFISEMGNPYDFVIRDSSGAISIELGAYGIPETYILDRETKKIIYKYIGPIDNEIKNKIEIITKS